MSVELQRELEIKKKQKQENVLKMQQKIRADDRGVLKRNV